MHRRHSEGMLAVELDVRRHKVEAYLARRDYP